MATDIELITKNEALAKPHASAGLTLPSTGVPAAIWRDPHTVPPEQRAALIESLEQACQQNPYSPELRTGLAMAHALNYDPYRSMDALEEALRIDPNHFFAQLKLAEIWYRVRAIPRAEQECLKALQLATNPAEYQAARKQLQEIRRIANNSWSRPTWDSPMLPSVLTAAAGICIILGLAWRYL